MGNNIQKNTEAPNSKNVYLCLEDGSVFQGESFGAEVESTGELVFNTSVVGYPEILSDTNYKGQIVLMTFPMIGNYGMVFDGDTLSPSISGFIVREACEEPSNFRCGGTLSDYLKKHGIPAICGVDTRAITRIIREKGPLNAAICKTIPKSFDFIKEYNAPVFAKELSVKEKKIHKTDDSKKKVAIIDLGNFTSAADMLGNMGCEYCLFPFNAKAEEIEKYSPDGVFISDGPGNPAELSETVSLIKDLIGNYPIFATGMGHGVLAIAEGLDTIKLKQGHRGSNIPSVCTQTKKTYITTQNHGYAVSLEGMPIYAKISFVNANDGSCEGLEYENHRAFSVQFRPDAFKGANDTVFLFEKFISLMD